MPLASGTRVGSYEIISLLGLARSPATPDRLCVFRREAHVLACLNHPHIAQFCGLADEADPRARAGVRMGRYACAGPDSGRVDDALRIARQVAEALEAPHAKGMVNRDLEPANIKISPTGVKVLDFGIPGLCSWRSIAGGHTYGSDAQRRNPGDGPAYEPQPGGAGRGQAHSDPTGRQKCTGEGGSSLLQRGR